MNYQSQAPPPAPNPARYPVLTQEQRTQLLVSEYWRMCDRTAAGISAWVTFSPLGVDHLFPPSVQATVGSVQPFSLSVDVLPEGNTASPPAVHQWLITQGFPFNGEWYACKSWSGSPADLGAFSEYVLTSVYRLPATVGLEVRTE